MEEPSSPQSSSETTPRSLHDGGNWLILCDSCSTICHSSPFQEVLFKKRDELTYTTSLQHLASNAGTCLLCDQLHQAYKSPQHENESHSDGVQAVYNRCKKEIVDDIKVLVEPQSAWDKDNRNALIFKMKAQTSSLDWDFTLAVMFWLYAESENHAAEHFAAREIDSDVDSVSSWARATQWLADCVENHQQCNSQSPASAPLPIRVIDVSGPDSVKLYCSNREPAKYAALSYCWGRDQPLMTTQTNIERYKSTIDVQSLPRTIRDAIKATRELGLQYLWVDSLCIIQDDKRDKRNEILRMRDIFKNSAITIVAASAGNVDAGFLSRREEPAPVCLRLPVICCGKIGAVFARNDGWSQYDPYADATEQRAWCLEEKLLPSRLLIYTATHLRWRCQRFEDCVYNRFRGDSLQLATRPQRTTDVAIPFMGEEDLLWESWQEVLMDYTNRTLTHDKDKLTAVAGLAEEFQKTTGDVYLAGLWQKHLVEDLLWFHPNQGFRLRPRPSTYRAPSWSWAAIDSMVRRYRGEQSVSPYFKVLECSVNLASPKVPLGEVVGGKLVVQSRVRVAIWDPETALLYESFDDADRNTACLPQYLRDDWRDRATELGEADADAIEPASSQQTHVLLLSVTTVSGVDDGQEGLVLVRAAESMEELVYRRIACFQLPEGEGEDEDWFRDAEEQVVCII